VQVFETFVPGPTRVQVNVTFARSAVKPILLCVWEIVLPFDGPLRILETGAELDRWTSIPVSGSAAVGASAVAASAVEAPAYQVDPQPNCEEHWVLK
jgi:hypothetical protein